MSSLDNQLSAFKNKIKSAPTISKPSFVVKRKEEDEGAGGQQKKRKVVPPVNPFNENVGRHAATQLMHAVEYIKKQVGVVPVENIRSYLSLQSADFLVPLLKKMDQMSYNAVQRGFEYMPKFNIRTKAQLMAFLKSQPTAKGLSVRDLKDGWADCLDSIEELEQSGDLIVLRTKKENSPRMMWANVGGPIGMVDAEFQSMWSRIKVPDESDLPSKLEEAGLKPTSVDPATIKSNKGAGNGQKKQKKPRRSKITNTHLDGVLKDYGR